MSIVRVATYNIHKGVQGLGPVRRLEIHNLAHAVEQFDADIVCLQEVRSHHRKFERYFTRWPELDQAGYLSPEGYEAVYRTNAVTRHGEHGNALLSRWPVLGVGHADVSDHRFEQRGLLHAQVLVEGTDVHVVVVHLGLIHASRERQVRRLGQFIEREVPTSAPLIVAGDFNDWSAQLIKPMAALDLRTFEGIRLPTYPARLPLLHLDRIFVRGLRPVSAHVPHGAAWRRMSDHLPLIADLEL
ncbi:MAG: endonuclease/exonuclease/phosphatase family protein [Hydrogenophaga sp.]|jgi:endonuclease/exonuclease/phosphatase family metal-dependent hydrolase|uniref:endonuclease/exonuclease/phosphatase family protein n=1 Tax=Hydrogenophaga intermedia TaxID=65786 RepID=UPI0020449B48|nr:endonuclease/exonuclease/phosphatase family protein [Hydrogenophaga intermedia]MCM3564008.1 endonuclease/exonuclease/phosphatase family protein [Hydrogenophaga intermedia]